VYVHWDIVDDSILTMRVYDGVAGIKHPVVVDPQYFGGRWLVRGALKAANVAGFGPLALLGCSARIYVDWPSSAGSVWYRRVWHAALACLVTL
jgi:hypothetical protein